MGKIKLIQCPVCGGEPEWIDRLHTSWQRTEKKWFVHCTHCNRHTDEYRLRTEAAAEWNYIETITVDDDGVPTLDELENPYMMAEMIYGDPSMDDGTDGW